MSLEQKREQRRIRDKLYREKKKKEQFDLLNLNKKLECEIALLSKHNKLVPLALKNENAELRKRIENLKIERKIHDAEVGYIKHQAFIAFDYQTKINETLVSLNSAIDKDKSVYVSFTRNKNICSCSICQINIEPREHNYKCRKCDGRFHSHCFLRLLLTNDNRCINCPLCRCELMDDALTLGYVKNRLDVATNYLNCQENILMDLLEDYDSDSA